VAKGAHGELLRREIGAEFPTTTENSTFLWKRAEIALRGPVGPEEDTVKARSTQKFRMITLVPRLRLHGLQRSKRRTRPVLVNSRENDPKFPPRSKNKASGRPERPGKNKNNQVAPNAFT
jgi:hypothetical protein